MLQRVAPFLPGLAVLAFWYAGWLGVIAPVAFIAIKVLGVLLGIEFIAAMAGDRRNRALLRYRWQSRRGRSAPGAALHLAQVFGLLAPSALDRDAALRAMTDLAERAVRLNLRHPNPLTGPLTLPRLNKALQLAAAQRDDLVMTTSPVSLATLWPQPLPDFSIGGVILDMRRFAGRLILRRTHDIIRNAIAGERAIRRRSPMQPRPQQRWRAADFPQHEIFLRASRLSAAAGLAPWNDDPSLLPLRLQFRLSALAVLLSGEAHAARRARMLSPFSAAIIDEVAADLDRWAALHGHLPPAPAPMASATPAAA